MNESTLTQLKMIVERAVRPVRAGNSRKLNMREELLAHVSDVFEEEVADLHDDGAALERTALRFGNPAEVTAQLQRSVPAGDAVSRFVEGRPEESVLRAALRFACLEGTLVLLTCGAVFCASGWKRAWSLDEWVGLVFGSAFLPFWLLGPPWVFGIALVAHWMEKPLHGPEPLTGWPRIGLRKFMTSAWTIPAVRAALIASCSFFFLLSCIHVTNRNISRTDWDQATLIAAGVLLVVFSAATSVLGAWVLVQSAAERRRRHEEWYRLPIEPSV